MTRVLRQHLEEKRRDALREAESRLQTHPGEDIDPQLQQISMYSSALSVLPANRLTENTTAALVWLLCASVVGLAWGTHMPETRIVLTANSGAVNLDLIEGFDWTDQISIHSGEATIDHMEMLELPGKFSRTTLTDNGWVDIAAKQLQLSSLSRASGGEFSIELVNDGVEIRSTDAALNGKFTLSGDARLIAGTSSGGESEDYSLSPDFPESVRFRSPGNGSIPGVLRFGLNPAEPMVFYNLQIRDLRLSQLTSKRAGSEKFISSITEGSVQLSDIGESADLNAHEPLVLRGVEGRISELRISDIISIRFDGVVKQISTGPEGFRTDLRPSVLQFIYHQQPLSFFFGAVTFLWGIFWSARKLLFARY